MERSLHHVLGKLDALRAELADLSFALERRGRHDAADVANTLSARVCELRDELFSPVRPPVADSNVVAAMPTTATTD